ncbi:MAG: DUF4920 domain-containing protein [Sandaracinaceae bacterium]
MSLARLSLGCAALLFVGCQTTPEPSARLEPAADGPSMADEPAADAPAADEHPDGAGSANHFGAALDESMPTTALADILAEPTRFEGQVVKTEGEVARVCQRMGCWMELRQDAESPGVRVPMAGHSFFLPRDCAGRRATMQGRVALRELSPEARAHLESEGAVATASALSIEASGVVLD